MHRCTGEVSVSKFDFQADTFLYNRHAKIIKHARTVVTGQPQMSMGEFVAASEQVEKRSMNRMAAEASSINPTDKSHAAHFEHSTDRDQGNAYDAVEKSGGMSIRAAMKEAGIKHKGPEEMDVKV